MARRTDCAASVSAMHESLLPYYLAILIHTAGNPEPIAALSTDCVQPIPLLDDRQMILGEAPRRRDPTALISHG